MVNQTSLVFITREVFSKIPLFSEEKRILPRLVSTLPSLWLSATWHQAALCLALLRLHPTLPLPVSRHFRAAAYFFCSSLT